MDTTIDEVSIQIGSNSENASSNLDKLAESISSLQSYVNTGLKSLGKFNSGLLKIQEITSGINFENTGLKNISSYFSGLSDIPKVDNLKDLFNQLKDIPNISKQLDEKAVAEFTSKVKGLAEALKPLATELVKVSSSFSALPTNLSKVNSALNSTKKAISSGKSKKATVLENILTGKVITTALVVAGIKKLGTTIGGFVNKSNEYIENMNLFRVSMGKSAEEAENFINKFTKVLGVDPSNMMRYMGMFNSLVEGFGIGSEAAYTMSKNLTQLSYDMSSFLNISIEDAMAKLKSGISGEIEPMRAVGIALDQATLQETAYSLGIKQRVNQMTRAQKTELLYYQIMTKTTKMQGDMARTLLQPANAIRIVKEQFTQLARAIGNIFIPILTAAIPYVMVITQLLTKLAQAIANFFGFEMPDFDYASNISGMSGVSSGIDGIGDSAKNTKKELDRMLAPFDELNVIEFDKDTSSGSETGTGVGTGGSLGIPLPEYDALTGALTQNLGEVEKKIKSILPYIESIGIAFATWTIGKSVLTFLDKLGLIQNLGSALRILAGVGLMLGGLWLIYKGVKKVIDEGLTPESVLMLVSGTALTFAGAALAFKSTVPLRIGISLGLAIVAGWLLYEGVKQALKEGKLTPKSLLKIVGGTAIAGVAGALAFKKITPLKLSIGLALGIASLEFFNEGIKGIQNGEITGINLLKSLGSSIGLGIAGKMLGLSVPLSLTLVGAGIIFTTAEIGRSKMWYPLKVALGMNGDYSEVWTKNFELKLVFSEFSFAWDILAQIGLEKQLKSALLKIVRNALEDVAKSIEKIPHIGKSIATGIRSAINAFEGDITQDVTTSVSSSISNSQSSINAKANSTGMELMLNLKKGASSENIRKQLTDSLVSTQKKSLTESTTNKEVISVGNRNGNLIVDNIKNGIGKSSITSSLNSLQKNGLNSSKTNKDVISKGNSTGNSLVNAIKAGINTKDNQNEITNSVSSTTKNGLKNTKTNIWSRALSVGINTILGIKSGINSEGNSNKSDGLLSTIGKIAKTVIIGGFKNALGIHSPSVEMQKQAKFVPLGIAKGINQNSKVVMNSMDKLSSSMELRTNNLLKTNEFDKSFYHIKNQIQELDDISIQANMNLNTNTFESKAIVTTDNSIDSITKASYEGVSAAMKETSGRERQPINVYVGNKKLYSGYGQYANSESNRFGTRTIKV